jgi:hypothetical protein
LHSHPLGVVLSRPQTFVETSPTTKRITTTTATTTRTTWSLPLCSSPGRRGNGLVRRNLRDHSHHTDTAIARTNTNNNII